MSTRRRLLLSLLTVVLFFALVEASLAAYSWLGLRGPRFEPLHSVDGPVVLALGDSFTFGLYLDPQDSYPSQLQARLAQRDGLDWQIVNQGLPGASPAMIHQQLDALVEEHDPDLVVLLAGFNVNDGDILAYRAEHGEGPRGAARRLIGAKLLLSKLRSFRVLRFLLHRGLGGLAPPLPQHRPGGMDLFDFRSYQLVNQQALSRLVGAVRGRDLPLVLMSYPQAPLPDNGISEDEYYYVIYAGHLARPLEDEDYLFPRRHPREMAINSVIRHVADDHQVPLVDHFSRFAELPDRERYFVLDDEHPNALGYGLMAETLHARLHELGLLPQAANRGAP